MTKTTAVFVFLFNIVFINVANGQSPTSVDFSNPLGSTTLNSLLSGIVTWLYRIAAPIVVAMLIYAGVKFITAKGEPAKVAQAKQILLYAVIGLAVILINVGFKDLIDSILGL